VNQARFKLRDFLIEKLPADPQGQINFVIVSPSAGVAPASLIIALNPKVVPYMRSGFYRLIVRFDDADASPPFEPPGGVVVSLVVLSTAPRIESVSNAASLQPGISPGQLVTIRGTHLSTPPQTGDPDPAGLFPKVLGNTAVTFNGIVAPLLYVSNNQINCVAPYELAGSKSAEVIVNRVDPAKPFASPGLVLPSAPVTAPVSDINPAIFTADESGSGPGAVLNRGPATGPNTESNPAPKGSTITFYATGAGLWSFPFPDGGLVLYPYPEVGPPPLGLEVLAPVAPVSVTIGGQPAKVVQAIAQRRRVFGVLHVDVQVPDDIGSGAQPVVLKIGDKDNLPQNVTVWVQ
jgi:uncharacterized protein (TIGR03437 family)